MTSDSEDEKHPKEKNVVSSSSSSRDPSVSQEDNFDARGNSKHIPAPTISLVTNRQKPQIPNTASVASSKPANSNSKSTSHDKDSDSKSRSEQKEGQIDIPQFRKDTGSFYASVMPKRVIINNQADDKTHGCYHLFVKHPFFIIFLILFIGLTSGIWLFKVEPFVYDAISLRQFLRQENTTYEMYDSINLARKEMLKSDDFMTPEDSWTTHLVITHKSSNKIFTQENVKVIRRIVAQIRAHNDTENFCIKYVNKKDKESYDKSKCDRDNFMKGIIFTIGMEVEDSEMIKKLSDLTQDPENRAYVKKNNDGVYVNSNITRVIFYYGSVNNEITDEEERAFKEYSKSIKDFAESIVDPELKFYIYSDILYQEEYVESVKDDCEYLCYSLAILFVYLWFRSKSLFVTICTFVQVIISLPIAYIMYAYIFRVKYLGAIHIIAIYVTLIITIENAIIFTGNWHRSKRLRKQKHSIKERLNYTMSKSLGAITLTTIISSLIYFASVFSKALSIASFGSSMLALTIINYGFFYSFFPCSLIFYWKYIRKLFDYVDCIRKLVNPRPESYKNARLVTQYNKGQIDINDSNSDDDEILDEEEKKRKNESKIQEELKIKNLKQSFIEYMFAKCYGVILTKLAIVMLAVFLGLMITMIYFCTKVTPMKRPEDLLPSKYGVSYARNVVMDEFGNGEGTNNVIVHFVFGIDRVDRSNVPYYDPDNLGDIVWSSGATELKYNTNVHNTLKNFCDKLKNVIFLVTIGCNIYQSLN